MYSTTEFRKYNQKVYYAFTAFLLAFHISFLACFILYFGPPQQPQHMSYSAPFSPAQFTQSFTVNSNDRAGLIGSSAVVPTNPVNIAYLSNITNVVACRVREISIQDTWDPIGTNAEGVLIFAVDSFVGGVWSGSIEVSWTPYIGTSTAPATVLAGLFEVWAIHWPNLAATQNEIGGYTLSAGTDEVHTNFRIRFDSDRYYPAAYYLGFNPGTVYTGVADLYVTFDSVNPAQVVSLIKLKIAEIAEWTPHGSGYITPKNGVSDGTVGIFYTNKVGEVRSVWPTYTLHENKYRDIWFRVNPGSSRTLQRLQVTFTDINDNLLQLHQGQWSFVIDFVRLTDIESKNLYYHSSNYLSG